MFFSIFNRLYPCYDIILTLWDLIITGNIREGCKISSKCSRIFGAFTFGKHRSLGTPRLFWVSDEARMCVLRNFFIFKIVYFSARVATITAFMVCIRFSASSKTTEALLSKTSSVTSLPFTAGRQCMKMQPFPAFFITSEFI